MLVNITSDRVTTTAIIASGQSVSGSVDLSGNTLVGFVAPAVWTTAALQIEGSIDNVTWETALYDRDNVAVGYWSAIVASAGYATDSSAMLPWRYVRIRSGSASSPTTQAGDRTFTLISRPLA